MPNEYSDIIFLRRFVDGSGSAIGHIYNMADETAECANTCYETASGDSSVIDNNDFDDEDGFADSCEVVIDITVPPTPIGPDNPFPCAGGTEPFQVDMDDDGINDTCDGINEQLAPVIGDMLIGGAACSLNTSNTQNPIPFWLLFSLVVTFIGFRFKSAKQN